MSDLIRETLATMADHARSGLPLDDGTHWTCGRCYASEGVRCFVVEVDTPDRFQYRLVCPCCSVKGCPHVATALTRVGLVRVGARLSAKEQQVLEASAGDDPLKRVAGRLGMAYSTAKNHRTRAFAKLGVRTLTGAYRQLGWLDVPEPE